MTPHKRKRRSRWRSPYLWHRYVGLCSALFVIALSITGLALNHPQALGLDARYIRSDWLLNHYGVTAPSIRMFDAGAHRVFQVGELIVFDDREIARQDGRLVGALALSDFNVVALESKILLLGPTGQTIEQIEELQGQPLQIEAIGQSEARHLVVRTDHGTYEGDAMLLEWRLLDAALDTQWAHSQDAPPAVEKKLIDWYRGRILSYERVLLDLHSGRVLGFWGVYIVDAAAVLFVVLALLGVWTWAVRRRR